LYKHTSTGIFSSLPKFEDGYLNQQQNAAHPQQFARFSELDSDRFALERNVKENSKLPARGFHSSARQS